MSEGAPGPSLVTSTTMLLIGIGRVAQRRLDGALAEHGLTLRHVGALGHLAHGPGLSYSDLARRAGVTVQSMHATIAALVDRGAISAADTGRGQRAQLRLTEHGRALLATAASIAHELDASWDLGDVDLAPLRSVVLDALRSRSTSG
jgi:DNA-binding MarR family transcriptional regulator